MEYVILGLLLQQTMTLYEMNREFKHNISLFYSASLGSLQAAVKGLLSKGWITFEEQVDRGRNKKIYTITENGRAAFHAWMQSETPLNKLEVVGLSKVYFLGQIEDDELKKQILREIIQKIELVESQLLQMNLEIGKFEIPPDYRTIARYRVKTLDYGIQAHTFAREWFVELLKELE